jgi:hypothetical protein
MGFPFRLNRWSRAAVLCAALIGTASAQIRPAVLTGSVKDSTGNAIGSVQLTLFGVRAMSDTAGRFLFANLPMGTGTLAVRRLGFAPFDRLVTVAEGRTDSLNIVLTMTARELAGITTEAQSLLDVALADYYRHKRVGNGHFFERADFENKNYHRMSDLLRRIPGVRIVTDRAGRTALRMGRAVTGRDCPPDFWIDGVRAPMLGVDDVPLEDVQALEVYGGPSGVPPEMNSRLGNPGCGVVVIWTRVPG